MTGKLFVLLGAAAALGAAGGLVALTGVDARAKAERDRWRDPAPLAATQTQAALAAALIDTGHFPEAPEVETADDQENLGGAEGQGPEEATPDDDPGLPIITSVSKLDGAFTISVRHQDASVETVRIGENLASGWTLVSADFQKVTFERDGEERIVTVFQKGDGGA